MNVLFRVDASSQIGTGHIVRCVALAQALASRDARVVFACRPLPGHLNQWLPGKGIELINLDGTPGDDLEWLSQLPFASDWLVVDHYGLDARWESKARAFARNILVIDDLANRPHDCDILLDQNRLDEASGKKAYQALTPTGCGFLMGPRYALLRPEFGKARQAMDRAKSFAEAPFTILAFFGGTDPTRETERLLPALKNIAGRYSVDIKLVVGGAHPNITIIGQTCEKPPFLELIAQTEDMAKLMVAADLSVTAGGATTWERLCLGLPGLVVVVAENQLALSLAVAEAGAQQMLGTSMGLSGEWVDQSGLPVATPELVERQVVALLKDVPRRERMREIGMEMVDGLGAGRVAEVMLSEFQRLPVV